MRFQSIPSHEIETRFWSKVDKGGKCWLWTASTDNHGYGQFNSGGHYGRPLKAHRVAWTLTHGDIPPGMCVLHNCPDGDNPACVNPAHLFLGTQLDNVRDMVRKGRSAKGDRNGTRRHPESHPHGSRSPGAKLTESAVREIRACHASGVASYSQLAARYGVHVQTIASIVQRKNWAHLE